MTNIMLYLLKRKDELKEMQLAAKQFEVAVFERVMVRKSTTKGLTGQALYETSRLVSLVVSRIVHANLNGHR